MSTVFFGTHQFAATILEGILKRHIADVTLVLTQPDRPVGRSQTLQPSQVKILAQKYTLPIEQPTSLKTYELRTMSYELGIVAQYGLLIPKHILDAFPKGILNVHTSLLPKYRGASPIQTAIMNGDTKTGITIMKMDEGLDTGPILLQKSLDILPDETSADMEAKLVELGIEALEEAVPAYLSLDLSPSPQRDADASTCRELKRDDGRVDWKKTAVEIYNQYRGLTPWPGIWTEWHGKRLKLLAVAPVDIIIPTGMTQVENYRIFFGCGKGSIEALTLQLAGGKPMDAASFIRGHKL